MLQRILVLKLRKRHDAFHDPSKQAPWFHSVPDPLPSGKYHPRVSMARGDASGDSITVRVFIFAGQSNMEADSNKDHIQRFPPFRGWINHSLMCLSGIAWGAKTESIAGLDNAAAGGVFGWS